MKKHNASAPNPDSRSEQSALATQRSASPSDFELERLVTRRSLLKSGPVVLMLGVNSAAKAASIVSVRVWPSPEYTRVTIESDTALQARSLLLNNPPRFAVDIEGIELNSPLKELTAKVLADDPYISSVRLGKNTPTTVRLVFDLKQDIKPQVFTLDPFGSGQSKYQYRLVFDLYPLQAIDPLEALIAEHTKAQERSTNTSQNTDDPLMGLVHQKDALHGASPTSAPVASAATQNALSPKQTTPSTPLEVPLQVLTPEPTPLTVPQATNTAPQNTPLSRSATDRFIVVALDPGHGGEDPGASGHRGTHEKDIVLKIAHKLQALINATNLKTKQGTMPMRAFMTRDADYFVPLQTRVEKAQRVQADLFISIHADAFFTPDAQGASVFALSQGGASSVAARFMANQENKADKVGGLNIAVKDEHLKRTLFDMSTTAQINDSLKLGSEMLDQIKRFEKLHKPQVEQASFAVLKAPNIPSILVETAFISNPQEETLLLSESHQNNLAQALMQGIERYFRHNPPLARYRST